MTRWGMLLLVAFVALATSKLDERTAVRTAVALITVVLLAVGVRKGAL